MRGALVSLGTFEVLKSLDKRKKSIQEVKESEITHDLAKIMEYQAQIHGHDIHIEKSDQGRPS